MDESKKKDTWMKVADEFTLAFPGEMAQTVSSLWKKYSNLKGVLNKKIGIISQKD